MPGGGAKDKIEMHPEWTATFLEVVTDHMAGDPMNEKTIWLNIDANGIRKEMAQKGLTFPIIMSEGFSRCADSRKGLSARTSL